MLQQLLALPEKTCIPSLHHANGTLCTCAGPLISCGSLLIKPPTTYPNKCYFASCLHTFEEGAVTASVALRADVCFGALVMDPRRHKRQPTPPTSSHQTTDRRMRRTARAHMLRGQPLLGWCTCVGRNTCDRKEKETTSCQSQAPFL